jgi:hypothetical protein
MKLLDETFLLDKNRRRLLQIIHFWENYNYRITSPFNLRMVKNDERKRRRNQGKQTLTCRREKLGCFNHKNTLSI